MSVASMRVLSLDPKDPWLEVALKGLHERSGFDYKFPKDFRTPLFPVRMAVVNEANSPIVAAALKVEAEAYLWMDHSLGTPESRMEAFQMLHVDVVHQARTCGFDQMHCVLPPEIADRFGKRLEDLGWSPARPWPLFTYQLR
jgi:hypothetical protein